MVSNSIIITELTPEQFRSLLEETLRGILGKTNPQEQPKDEALWNSAEIEKMLGISKITLYLWRKKRQIPYHRIGKKIFYKKSEIERVMDVLTKYNSRRA
jgi:predicted DNA-binding transcriptional regulator AlpA